MNKPIADTNFLSGLFNPVLVHEFLTFSAGKFPDKEAVIFGDTRLTYKELEQQSDNLACFLLKLGIERHDRIIIFGDNSVETIISIYGILKTGAAFIVLNGTIKTGKLQYIIKDSGARLIISQDSKLEVTREAINNPDMDIPVIWFGNNIRELQKSDYLWSEILVTDAEQYRTLTKRKSEILDYDLASLIYTSGSTGEPKGVMSAHFNIVTAARSIIQYIGNIKDDRILVVLPLSFDYGLYQVIMTFMFGGTIVLEKSFNFPMDILKVLQKEKITGFPIVPTILAMLLET